MSNISNVVENSLPHSENLAPEINVYSVDHLGMLLVTGSDAAKFLQGQCTCDVLSITESNSSFGAFCNAKGRVISTFIITKQTEDYLLILPLALLPVICKRLQLYILRAKVKLTDCSQTHFILGLSGHITNPISLPVFANFAQAAWVPYPEIHPARYLLVLSAIKLEQSNLQLQASGYKVNPSVDWQYLDIQAGIPWLNPQNSEEYIPQMLNLDQLNGISYNKGCYTGQEIVARTHYLGKSKRSLFIAKTDSIIPISLAAEVTEMTTAQKAGSIVSFVVQNNGTILLLVLNDTAAAATTLNITQANYPAIECTVIE